MSGPARQLQKHNIRAKHHACCVNATRETNRAHIELSVHGLFHANADAKGADEAAEKAPLLETTWSSSP